MTTRFRSGRTSSPWSGWDARHGLSSADYQHAFDQFSAQGELPIDVHGGGSGSNALYAAVFANQVDTIPRAWTVLVLADRGLYARWLFRRIVRVGWHPFLRINQGCKFRPQGQTQFVWLSELVGKIGQR